MSDPLPFFDYLLERFRADDRDVLTAFGRHVHWGYWSDPRFADGSVADFANAADRLTDLVCDAAGITDACRVVDCGCGFGGTVESINKRFERVSAVGVNVDHRQLTRARNAVSPRGGNRILFVQADACGLPVTSGSADAVLAIESAFHFSSRQEFFREARRVLRPGGRLVIADFVPPHAVLPFTRFGYRLLRPIVASGYANVDNGCSIADYRRLGRAASFRLRTVDDVTAHTRPTYRVVRRVVRDTGSWTVRTVTALADWVSALRIVRYAILAFEAT